MGVRASIWVDEGGIMCVSAGWSGRGALWQCNMRSKVTNRVRAKEPRIMSLPPHSVRIGVSFDLQYHQLRPHLRCRRPHRCHRQRRLQCPHRDRDHHHRHTQVRCPPAVCNMVHATPGSTPLWPTPSPHLRTLSISIPTHPLSLPSVSPPRPRPPVSLYTYCAAASPIPSLCGPQPPLRRRSPRSVHVLSPLPSLSLLRFLMFRLSAWRSARRLPCEPLRHQHMPQPAGHHMHPQQLRNVPCCVDGCAGQPRCLRTWYEAR